MNKQYAKLENGAIVYAPNGIELEDHSWQIPPSEETLISLGYKEIEFTTPPEYEKKYVNIQSFEETDDKIRQVWTKEYVEPAAESLDEKIDRIDAQVTYMAMMSDMLI